LRLFQQRKPTETKEWQQKLPDFVLRLEEAVYRGARSKVRDVRFPFARRFFHDEKRRLGFNSVVSPVFFIGRVFSATLREREKKPCLRLPRGTASGGAGDASIARCETANASTTRVVGRLRRRIGASNPGSSRERDADEPTFRLRTTETLRATTFFLRIRDHHRATPRVSSPAPLARYDAIRQHTQLRALNAALCPL